MANTSVTLPGTGTPVDGFTPSGSSDVRQAVVVASPTVDANVAEVSATGDLQVYMKDLTATGTITTQNLVPAGTATPGSAVLSGALNGQAVTTFQVTGTYTGALSVQGTVDGSTWVTLGGPPLLNVNTGVMSATVPSATQSIYQVNTSGYNQVRVTGLAAMTGTATVTMRAADAVSAVNLSAPLPAGTNNIGGVNVAQINGVAATMGNGVSGTGVLRVTVASDSTGVIGTTPVAATTTNATLNSAATTNATSVKASAGNLYAVVASNINAAARYLKLYNKASAPTVGTDVPVLTIPIPASGVVAIEFGTQGFRFATGIAFALTTGNTDADTAAVAASEIKVMLSYI